MGVRRVDDPHHPRGYREIRSNAEMRKLMDRKIVAQNGACALCRVQFTDYERHRSGPHQCPRHGRVVEGRPSRQHPGGPLVVQWRKGFEQGVTNFTGPIAESVLLATSPAGRRL